MEIESQVEEHAFSLLVRLTISCSSVNNISFLRKIYQRYIHVRNFSLFQSLEKWAVGISVYFMTLKLFPTCVASEALICSQTEPDISLLLTTISVTMFSTYPTS